MLALLFGAVIDLDQLDELDAQGRRRVRAAQVSTVVRLIPMSMSMNVINAIIVFFVFLDAAPIGFLIGWTSIVGFAAVVSFWSWHRSRRRKIAEASARSVRRLILHSVVLGMTWGVLPLVLFPGADLIHQMVIACLVTGMISGCAFGLSTVPMAGLVYTWSIVIGAELSLFLTDHAAYLPFAILMPLYAVFLSRNLVAHGNLFVNHLRDQFKLEAQGELITLLLNDFQENASDWLWEVDAGGVLKHVSDRFAEAAGRKPAEMQGIAFSELIGGLSEIPPPGVIEIVNQMRWRMPFRDIVVPYAVGEENRFWLLSAKPVFDNAGKFTGYHGVGADVTDKRLAEERITHLAYSDPITSLPNRTAFCEQVARALDEARENGQSAALLCLDLDRFKSVNDTLGHPIGDELLAAVGKRIRACARDRDIVARLGGDEFAILQIGPTLPADTMVLARQIIDAFKEPFKLKHGELATSTGIGIAIVPDDGWSIDALLQKAELGLYAAKKDGTGNYRFFEPEMESGALRRRAIEDGLRAALKNGEMQIAFQPLVDLGTWSLAGCEALARWKSPEWGYVSPVEFIPVAEATGLIDEIGDWVLRQACTEAMNWPDDTVVAVNLSAVQFRNQKLLSTVVAALAESGLPPHRLELEVTESIFLDGGEGPMQMLQHLRTLGVRTSLDDFGTGYSSLSYLRLFPFDKIKIDKSFINDVAARDESLAIIRAIVALANALGMSTTAEGVESTAQVAKLRDAGCTQIQGYVFSPPRSGGDILDMFAPRLGTLPAAESKPRQSATS